MTVKPRLSHSMRAFYQFKAVALASILLSAGHCPSAALGRDLTGTYSWKPLKIGGGGWVVGMDIHPSEEGLMYVRTDVSGAYRWQPRSRSWKQLVTAESMPASVISYGAFRGVDSLVGAPQDPDIAYMAYRGEVYRSTNQGDTWTPTSLERHSIAMEPNGEGRQEGERLAVDPHNSDVVYYGAIADGLWRTEDAGEHWNRVQAIPKGAPHHGVNTIVFDKHSETVRGASGEPMTSVIYATVDQQGVYRTEDAGTTWAELKNGPPSSARIREAALGPDRTYFITTEKGGKDNAGTVWKYSPEQGWADITPAGSQAYWAIAVDPRNASRLVVLCNGGISYTSLDQGKTWAKHSFTLKSDEILWLGRQDNYWLSVGECAFDSSGTLWFAEGFGVWSADHLPEGPIEWHAASKGIEETCGNDIIAPAGGPPVAAMWDVGVFSFPDPDAYTANRGAAHFNSAWALDWCPADPNFIVGVWHNHNELPPHVNESGYSTDGGVTWTVFPAVEKKEAPGELAYGVIAVSADRTENIVWAPAQNHLSYFSKDRGQSWTRSSFGGPEKSGFGHTHSPLKPLCADRVEPGTFYFYRTEDGVYRSTDEGATFAKMGNPVSGRYNSTLKAAPTHAGHLWFSEGHQGAPVGGLWRSQDGGATWSSVQGIDQAFNFGFGKPREDGAYLTLFVAGVVGDRTGLFRSTDEGASWDQIGTYPLGIFDWIDAIDGDKDVFGKVYLGFTSAGFAYGQPSSPETPENP